MPDLIDNVVCGACGNDMHPAWNQQDLCNGWKCDQCDRTAKAIGREFQITRELWDGERKRKAEA